MLDATDCNVLQQLTPKQQAAIDLLLSGRNDRETAEVVGAHRTTISRWRLHDLAFVDELNRRRREVYGAADLRRVAGDVRRAAPGAALRLAATEDESGAARTRTWNQRIMSPVRTLMALRMT